MNKRQVVYAVLAALLLSLLGGSVFSYAYEPLDVAAHALGVEGREVWRAIIPDYSLGVVVKVFGAELDVSTVLSGVLGSMLVMVITYLVARLARPRNR